MLCQVCDVGYTGQLAYDPKWNRWDGACALAACPANAHRPTVFVEDGTDHLCRSRSALELKGSFAVSVLAVNCSLPSFIVSKQFLLHLV